jgi:hypothetical protein
MSAKSEVAVVFLESIFAFSFLRFPFPFSPFIDKIRCESNKSMADRIGLLDWPAIIDK